MTWKTWEAQHASLVRRKARLASYLGGKCARCGEELGGEDTLPSFHFHHPLGREWSARSLSWSMRLCRYWEEARAGILELVCARCHRGMRRREWAGEPRQDARPF